MANPIKPIAGNTVGLTAADTQIGTDCKNARIWVVNPGMNDSGLVYFRALYFWNQNTFDIWSAESGQMTRTVYPWREQEFAFQSDPDQDLSLRKKCYAYLLSIPPFSGSFE